MKYSPIVSIGLALTLLVSGCSGSTQKEKPRPPGGTSGGGNAGESSTPAFRLTCGEGGGFTGGWSGFVLEADGRVATWQGRDSESSPGTPAGTATIEERNRLWSALQSADFFTRTVDEPGNMTRSVRVEAGARSSSWNWSFSPGPDSTARSTVWNACQDLLQRVKAREE